MKPALEPSDSTIVDRAPPTQPTIVDLIQYRAESAGAETAYTFVDGESKTLGSLTYRECYEQARAIAVALRATCTEGDRVLILCAPGLNYIVAFYACLFAGVLAVPVFPPQGQRDMERLGRIVANAQPTAALLDQLFFNLGKGWLTTACGREMHAIAIESVPASEASLWRRPQDLDGETVAFLQYTSGSTSAPKGVMVTHDNILHNQALISAAFGHSASTVFVSWLPTYHDMGLIGNVVLQPLYLGRPSFFMSPLDFVRKPISWLRAMTKFGGTTSGGPNFAYDLCVAKVASAELGELDLSAWDVAFNGAEPIRAATLQRFAAKFAACGFRREAFYPCYGLAEATLLVTGGRKLEGPIIQGFVTKSLSRGRPEPAATPGDQTADLVSSGRAAQEVVVADPSTRRALPAREIGEIWVRGRSVARGYWDNPLSTEESFRASLADGRGPFLRTGDLGFWEGDALIVTGRLKDLIIINGEKCSPQDFEETAQLAAPALRKGCGAAFGVDDAGEERVVLVQEVDPKKLSAIDPTQLATDVSAAVARRHHAVLARLVLISPGELLKTPSGKIQRAACKQRLLDGAFRPLFDWRSGAREDAPASPPERVQSNEGPSAHDGTSAVAERSERAKRSHEQATELIGWLRDYATFRINSRVMDERRSLAPHVVLDFGNHGVLGMAVPQRYGGLELAPSDVMRVTQQLAAIDLTLASFVGVNHALGTLPIVRHGSPPLQERLLPSLASGRILAAFALTERAAGSNPLAMQATARIQADGSFRIDANKSWIGSGSWASVLNVFARTYDASGQPLGISGFAVAHDSPGVRHGEEALTLGMRAMVQNDVHFDQVRVGESELLGGVGSGMEVAQDAMNFGRLGIAAMSVGALKRCTQLMTRFAQRRRIGTGSLLENPVTVLRLSEVTASARALETLVDEACGALERGETLPAEVFAVCKVAGSELLWRAADHLVQMLGARGYTENNGATQLLRDARLLRIFEGPSETLLCFLGASLIARPTQLLSFLEQTCQAAGVARELAQAQERVVLQLAANIELENVETSPTALQFALGECITFGVLAATLKRAAGTSRAEHAEIVRSLLWAEQQFTLRLAALTPSAPRAWLVTPEQICAIAARSSDEIGDILQRLPGVEDRMDPLLTPTGSEPPATVKPAFSAALAANPVSTIGRPLPSVPVVEAWLKDWLAQHLKVNRASLRSEAAFVEYGLDSVKAVQLAADLEGWLGIRIDRTMVWDYPHIASIAQRIAGSEQAFGGSSPQPPKAGSGHDTRPELESLSEPELVALLKEELAQCK